VGQAAIQSLAVDIANLTTRLAIAQATMNQVLTYGNQFDLDRWQTKRVEIPVRSTDESVVPEYQIVAEVPLAEVEHFQVLLQFLKSLQSEV
jgi:hypothetical protein